jgi:hypothetical protein
MELNQSFQEHESRDLPLIYATMTEEGLYYKTLNCETTIILLRTIQITTALLILILSKQTRTYVSVYCNLKGGNRIRTCVYVNTSL